VDVTVAIIRATAPVSHQKRPHRNATNAIECKRNRSKINEADRYPPAHNGLVAGSSPAGQPSLAERVKAATPKPKGRRRAARHASYGSASQMKSKSLPNRLFDRRTRNASLRHALSHLATGKLALHASSK